MIELLLSTAEKAIVEAHLKRHPDAQTLADEWNGVTNPVLRRKLQNRLNQRAARRRKAAATKRDTESLIPVEDVLKPMQGMGQEDLMTIVAERANAAQRWLQPIAAGSDGTTFCSIRNANRCQPAISDLLYDRLHQVQSLYKRIAEERDSRAFYPLPADHLLSLVYYNVYRALVANVAVLGLDLDLMNTDDYPSPFTPCSPTATSAIRYLPPAMQPTELQRSVAHHPQWDLVPVPACRDNLLRRGQDVDISDVELCMDLIGTEERRQKAGKKQDPAGCIVWGDPWDLHSWEVTEVFVRKYPWLFEGTSDIEASTNAHRKKRGEKPLRFIELGVPSV